MANVGFTHNDVTALIGRWTLIRDCISGEEAIKKQGKKYLPQPNEDDDSKENGTRYKQYLLRALFYNVTARTLSGLAGQVFSRDPVATIPPQMEALKVDTDGNGLNLDQQARKALNYVLAYGRAGLLVDFPAVDGPVSKADMDTGKVRPTLCLYEPWQIINWRVTSRDNLRLLTLVVISEMLVTDDDGFEMKREQSYRVLRLDPVTGNYIAEIWRAQNITGDANGSMGITKTYTPLDAEGKPWKVIPFTFIGAENNDASPDLPPMYDMACVNIAHYRNSADYEESCFMVGQPTPYASGVTQEWVEQVFKGEIKLGSRTILPLPEGGTAGLIQAESNTMPFEAMQAKEKQMVALGAQLVEQKSVERTATEAGIDQAGKNSLLASSATNVSHAYTKALQWAAEFMGVVIENATDLMYELNTNFDITRLPATDLTALIAAWQSNTIAWEELRDNLRRGGMAYLSDLEATKKINDAGKDLGVPVGNLLADSQKTPQTLTPGKQI